MRSAYGLYLILSDRHIGGGAIGSKHDIHQVGSRNLHLEPIHLCHQVSTELQGFLCRVNAISPSIPGIDIHVHEFVGMFRIIFGTYAKGFYVLSTLDISLTALIYLFEEIGETSDECILLVTCGGGLCISNSLFQTFAQRCGIVGIDGVIATL